MKRFCSTICLVLVLSLPVAAADRQVVPMPNRDNVEQFDTNTADASDAVFGGRGHKPEPQRPDIDLPKFDIPQPNIWLVRLLWNVVSVVLNLVLNLAILLVIAWLVYRAVQRHKGVKKEDRDDLYSFFDRVKADLQSKRAEAVGHITEIDKRLGTPKQGEEKSDA